ncbi:TIGR02594 family protein [Aquimarina sp. 2201CG5-10]|uniref:TIGR02594 family protein n=1 Tax=Aquimarina callyspongiae TaxID=3098150 RepID=UPI002AB35B79|nr:TIGR02594 family protein [Aquimarina sp. 2201CG5-10]MDY8137550.1 TIGR02594 family protein [Aquimarina sp. 2201CG5-10]
MDYFDKALSQFGIKEITGENDNPEVLKYFNELGFDGEKLKDETAWCSAFVNWCCKTTGYPYSGKLNARSWLNIGNETTLPKLGDIAVFWRENKNSWKGHVAFFIRETKDFVYVLGGNQNNRVNIKAYPKNRVLQFRTLC